MSQAQPDSVEILNWDSNFFGVTVGRLRLERPTVKQLSQTVQEADGRHIECLYWLVESDDPPGARAASKCGFRLVDIRVTLEHTLEHLAPTGPNIRPFHPSDLTKLLPITAASHRASRFFQDGNFPEEKCAALYQVWLENACRESSDLVLVADAAGQPAGYCICRMEQDNTGSISLIAVDSTLRGSGAGTALVRAALDHFKNSGARLATVVTQASNIASQRLYQRSGFVTRSVQLWYHRWRTENS